MALEGRADIDVHLKVQMLCSRMQCRVFAGLSFMLWSGNRGDNVQRRRDGTRDEVLRSGVSVS